MNFLVPAFFWGLFALAIPILIHLFHFRRFKTIYFSNTMMLRQLQHQNKTRTKLKHWLILIMRLLMIIALIFAFAQPFIPSNSSSNVKEKVIIIYVDNSFSMLGEIEKGRKLDVAREYAYDIVSSFAQDMQFYLITNDFLPSHQRILNQNEIKQELADIQASSVSVSIEDVLHKANTLIRTNSTMSLYILSDCQASNFQIGKIDNFPHDVFLIPISSDNQNNISIDSCWFESPIKLPNKPEEMKVKLTNHSSQAAINIPIKFFIHDTLKSFIEINIEANQSETISINYTEANSNEVNGKVEIEDYPVVFDNTLYFNYSLSSEIKLLHIYENSVSEKYISSIYNLDNDNMIYSSNRSGTEVASDFSNNQLIICNGIKSFSTGLMLNLNEFMNKGGSVLVIPGKEIDLQSYRDFFEKNEMGKILDSENTKRRVSKVNYKHYLFKEVFYKIEQNPDLPEYSVCFPMQVYVKSGADIALYDLLNRALVVSKAVGYGKLIYCAIPILPDNLNFITHPIFLPLFYNAAMYSGSSSALYYTLGKTSSIDINNIDINNKDVFHVRDSFVDIIPEYRISTSGIRLSIPTEITHSGYFNISYGNKLIKHISLNYYREESKQDFLTGSECIRKMQEAGVKNVKNIESDRNKLKSKVIAESIGIMLWKYFLIAALLFILAEILIIRFMK